MKERFIISTGTPDFGPEVEELHMYYNREKVALFMMLIGGIMVIISVL